MSYIALRDFDNFKKGDSIPEEIVEGRLIRGKKIGLVQEVKEELITVVTAITEVAEAVQENEEILLEDSSAVTIEINEEIVPEVLAPVEAKETKKSKK